MPQSMVELVKYEEDDVVTPDIVHTRAPSLLVQSPPKKASGKDRSTMIHSMVPIYTPEIKEEDVVDDIVPAENTVASATLKRAEKNFEKI